jgi:dTDP-4-amino-4,6-dideoxygalactose transaminase
MPAIPFLDLRSLNLRFKEDLLAATARVLERGWFINGEELAGFEQEFAAYCGSAHAIGVGNGLDAITLILRALLQLDRLQPQAEVLVPGNTFIASALAVTASGLAVRLVEPESSRFGLDPDAVQSAIGPNTQAILAVHLYGRLADVQRLRAIAERHHLLLIEDAAQAHGASLAGQRAGTWGVAAAFSLFPGKPLGALGDAGIITTGDAQLAACIRLLRNYGSQRKYIHEIVGMNSRLDELQAAFLRIKLRHLDADNLARDAIARRYCAGIRHPALSLPAPPAAEEVHAWHLFVLRCAQRDALQAHLRQHGIETLIHYPHPIHQQAPYRPLGTVELAVSETLGQQVLSLPIYPGLTCSQIDTIISACNSFQANIQTGGVRN